MNKNACRNSKHDLPADFRIFRPKFAMTEIGSEVLSIGPTRSEHQRRRSVSTCGHPDLLLRGVLIIHRPRPARLVRLYEQFGPGNQLVLVASEGGDSENREVVLIDRSELDVLPVFQIDRIEDPWLVQCRRGV